MTLTREQTILLVSDDAVLCAAARREFEFRRADLRVAAVSSVEAAHRTVEQVAPAVILLEETSLPAAQAFSNGDAPSLESIVSSLASYAPVVVIAAAHYEAGLATLVAAGSADFVLRSGGCLAAALELVEQRLTQIQHLPPNGPFSLSPGDSNASDEFGQVLRHELNNPLTGILGNAELLLAEVRRKNDGRLPNGGQQRLETIASLAVRLRETVRRLSQEWEARHDAAH